MDTLQPTQPVYLVKQGIAAARAGRFAKARRLLQQAVECDPDNEMAWLWLSGLMETVEEKRACLEHVLRINPENAYARAGLARLEKSRPSPDDAELIEARLAAVTGGSAHTPDTSAQNESAKPIIKPLRQLQPSNAPPSEPARSDSNALLCPGCDHPISPGTRVCPHCYLQLKSFEELLSRHASLPPTQPRKPKRKGIFGLFSD